MDNLCHTLAGAALGEAGLKRTTRLGMATLLIGANLPDVDVVAVPLGVSLAFRRGWTHGVLAMLLLPLVLAALVLLWDRWRRGRRRAPPQAPLRPRWVLLLAYVGVLSHPLLDLLNTYGVRLLMPFSGRWYYGDALFIVDPWAWAALAVGVVAARRHRVRWPAAAAAGALAGYAALMAAGSWVGRGVVADALGGEADPARVEIMAGPVPVNPFRREVVVREGERYRFGSLRLLPRPRLELVEGYSLPVNADHPAARAAAATEQGRSFLVWSRFPYFVVEEVGAGGVRVRLDDARYSAGDPSWAATVVQLPLASETPLAAAP